MVQSQFGHFADPAKSLGRLNRVITLLDSRAVNVGAVSGRIVATLRGQSVGRLKVLGAVCLFVAFGGWAVASPVGSSPDEDYHLVSVWCSHGERAGICESPTADSAVVPAALLSASCFKFQPMQSAACQRQPQQPAMVRRGPG